MFGFVIFLGRILRVQFKRLCFFIYNWIQWPIFTTQITLSIYSCCSKKGIFLAHQL